MAECVHRHLMLSRSSAVINNVFISEETRGRREWRNLNESERSIQALKMHIEFDLQSWSYFVKLTLQDINTTQKETKTERGCNRRQDGVQGWSYEALAQNLQKVGFEVVKCDKHSSLGYSIRDAGIYLFKVKAQLDRTAYRSCHCTKRVVPKSYRPKGQPRSARNEFPIRADFGNSRKHSIWRIKRGGKLTAKKAVLSPEKRDFTVLLTKFAFIVTFEEFLVLI